VGSADIVPLSGNAAGNDMWPEGNSSQRFNVLRATVGPGYFGALRVPLVAGRDFDARDTAASEAVIIVNETFVARLPHGVPAVGTHVVREATPGGPEKTYRIVGVVRNSKYLDLKEEPSPVAFMADTQGRPAGYAQLLVRSALPASAVTAAMTAALASIDPRITVTYSVLTDEIQNTLLRERLLATLSGGFGLLAAVLTIVGLYGLIAYTVTRRTNEIGVRLALGATRSDVARVILRETGLLLAIGVCVGILLALIGGRAATALLFNVKPHDPLTLAAAVLGLAVIGILASYGPARRATRIEPVAALRTE
jgi:ABC-type antimicrobial peptide transport system permease subunit